MPEISVIIPCYNANASMLIECIKSILAQSFQDFEIIIVDDGSSREYQEVFINVEKIDNRIRMLSQKNQGCSAARNNGVAVSKGKFIVFVDADDILLPDFFSEAIDIQKRTNADFIIGGNAELGQYKPNIEREPQTVKLLSSQERESFKQHILVIKHFDNAKCYFGRGPWSRLIKRETALMTPFPTDLSLGEDIVWNLELLSDNIQVCIAYRVWYLYRKHGDSAARRYNENVIEIFNRELDTIQKFINLEDDAVFSAYCGRILEDLKSVYTSYLGRKECPLNRKEKSQRKREIYNQLPWLTCGEKRFRRLKFVPRNQKIKSFLYRSKCLFSFFKLREIIEKIGFRETSNS